MEPFLEYKYTQALSSAPSASDYINSGAKITINMEAGKTNYILISPKSSVYDTPFIVKTIQVSNPSQPVTMDVYVALDGSTFEKAQATVTKSVLTEIFISDINLTAVYPVRVQLTTSANASVQVYLVT